MGKNKTLFIGFVLGIAATTAIQCSSGVAPTEAGASPRDVSASGRYQISTVIDEYVQVYSTILDTETGKIVRTERRKSSRYPRVQ
jgi:hypothetical protein